MTTEKKPKEETTKVTTEKAAPVTKAEKKASAPKEETIKVNTDKKAPVTKAVKVTTEQAKTSKPETVKVTDLKTQAPKPTKEIKVTEVKSQAPKPTEEIKVTTVAKPQVLKPTKEIKISEVKSQALKPTKEIKISESKPQAPKAFNIESILKPTPLPQEGCRDFNIEKVAEVQGV